MYSGYSESLLYSSDPIAVTGYQTARITAAVYMAGFQMAAVGRAVLKLQQISMWHGWFSNCYNSRYGVINLVGISEKLRFSHPKGLTNSAIYMQPF
jgi:hypothetical protein